MLFTSLGQSILRKTLLSVLNEGISACGLCPYIQDLGHSFSSLHCRCSHSLWAKSCGRGWGGGGGEGILPSPPYHHSFLLTRFLLLYAWKKHLQCRLRMFSIWNSQSVNNMYWRMLELWTFNLLMKRGHICIVTCLHWHDPKINILPGFTATHWYHIYGDNTVIYYSSNSTTDLKSKLNSDFNNVCVWLKDNP